jgi:peroxiredoxin-like protein
MEPHYYHVHLNWKQNREGVLSSPDVTEHIIVATPPPFPGGIPNIWSPEHLFTSAIVSCFMTTFLSIAEKSKLSFSGFSCNAMGKLASVDGHLAITDIELKPTILINNSADIEKTEKLLQKAEQYCLISNSVKSNIHLSPNIVFT